MSSILNDVKKLLGIDSEYKVFDTDIIIHINSAFATLHQLGVGTEQAYAITDDEDNWSSFIDKKELNSVKTYVYAKVRILFDPPGTSYGIQALEKVCKELEWRLNVKSELMETS